MPADPSHIKRNADRAIEQAKLISSPEFKANLDTAIAQNKQIASPEFTRRLKEVIEFHQHRYAGPTAATPDQPGYAEPPAARTPADVHKPPDADAPAAPELDDPFGLMKMDAEGVTRWLTGGHCEPGSMRWEQAKAVQVFKIAGATAAAAPPAPPSQRWWNRVHWGMVSAILAGLGIVAAIIIAIAAGGGG